MAKLKSKDLPNVSDLPWEAIHEAGHAVAAWLRSVHVGRISMKATATVAADAMVGGGSIHDMLTVLAAGVAAEQIAFDDHWRGDMSGSGDFGDAEKLMRKAKLLRKGEGFEPYWEQAVIGARVLLEHPPHWRLVESLASALKSGAVMSGDEVNRLIERRWK